MITGLWGGETWGSEWLGDTMCETPIGERRPCCWRSSQLHGGWGGSGEATKFVCLSLVSWQSRVRTLTDSWGRRLHSTSPFLVSSAWSRTRWTQTSMGKKKLLVPDRRSALTQDASKGHISSSNYSHSLDTARQSISESMEVIGL